MRGQTSSEAGPVELTEGQATDAFNTIAQRELGINGDEFLRRKDAGEYDGVDVDAVPGLVDVWMALPLVR